ncbi:MAG: carbohydrate ABC transporter substrate-binding protein [Oscillospiraceae bacterium]
MKKVLSLALSAVLSLGVLAGCAGGASSSTASTGGSTPSGSAGGSFAGQELNIAVFEGGYGPEYWNQVVSLFEEKYDVTVNMQISPTIGDIIRPQIVAGTVPDFISMNDNDQSGLIASMIKEKSLLEITDLFDQPGLENTAPLKDQVLDGILDSAKAAPYGDGKIYLAPFNSSPMGFIYDANLFATKGWELPETWDEFFALGDVAKEEGYALFTYPGIYPSYMESLLFPAIANEVGLDGFQKIMSFEDGSFNNAEVLAVLENVAKISSDDYLLKGTVGLNHTQSQNDMMLDKALFIPNGTWIENEMADAPRADGFEFGMMAPPVMNSGDTRYIMTSVEQFSVPAAAKNPELAKEFIRFLYTEDSVKLFAEHANGVYALKDATSMVQDQLTPGVANMVKAYEGTVSMVVGWEATPQGSKIVVNDEMFNPLTDVMNGTMTATQWAESVEKAFAQLREDQAAA